MERIHPKIFQNTAEDRFLGNYGEIIHLDWIDDNIAIQTPKKISVVDINGCEIQTIAIDNSTIFTTESDLIILCSWRNKHINSLKENATSVEIKQLSGEILLEGKFHQTVRFLTCSSTDPTFIDNYPNSLERVYKLDRNDNLVETENLEQDQNRNVHTIGNPMIGTIYIDEMNNVWYKANTKKDSLQ